MTCRHNEKVKVVADASLAIILDLLPCARS